MKSSKTTARVIQILNRLFQSSGFDTDLLVYSDLIDDLGMDSVNFVSLIIEIENEFDIQIPDDWLLMENFRDCSLISSIVEKLIMQKERADGNDDQ